MNMTPKQIQSERLRGAQIERQAILRKLRREIRVSAFNSGRALIAWILQRNERYEKRASGLGRVRSKRKRRLFHEWDEAFGPRSVDC